MATIGSLGVGSGLDLNGLLDKLAAGERQPLVAIKARQAAFNAKLSAYGTLQSSLSTFQAAAKKLADPAFMAAFKTSSSAPDVLGASADSTAVAGSYDVMVTRLARAQSLVAVGVSSTTSLIGSGTATVTIEFGAIAGTLNQTTGTYEAGATFTADAAQSNLSLTIDSSNNTLAGIRDAINEAAGTALSATIVNDGTDNRLVLTSSATGQKSSMRVTVSGDNTVLESLLANDPAGAQALRQTVTASDAALTVNGIAVTSTSNTVASSIQGVTLSVGGTGSSVLKVERDSASVDTAINDFVTAYNTLLGKLGELSAYDINKKSGGALVGDSGVRFIQTRLRSVLVDAQPGGAADPKTLSDIGIRFQTDGKLAADAVKLAAALSSNPAGVAGLFTGATATTGVATKISSVIDGFNQSDGLLKAFTDGANGELRRLSRDYEAMQDRIDLKLARYRAQFQQLDAVMSGMNVTSNYLAQQFAKK
jgi:flagellar hook-associated protein 2